MQSIISEQRSMNIRSIRFLPLLLLPALVSPGCSETDPPTDPSFGGSVPSHLMDAQFHWNREVHPDSMNVFSYFFLDCRKASNPFGVDGGVVRFQGMEIGKSHDDFYSRSWEGIPVGEGGRYKGTFVIEASGSGEFPYLADTVAVDVVEPAIITPAAGDTVSLSKGFIIEWEKQGDGGKVDLTFSSYEGSGFSRSGKVADNGRLIVEPDMVEGMKPGKWSIGITRQYQYESRFSDSRQSRVRIFPNHTIYLTTTE